LSTAIFASTRRISLLLIERLSHGRHLKKSESNQTLQLTNAQTLTPHNAQP
jgi:hypothetical protein